uniref:Protein brambleberry n=1 Tax=Arion vulgaris TaxID=1028688 RepID=A0A0B7ARD3_9EUPU
MASIHRVLIFLVCFIICIQLSSSMLEWLFGDGKVEATGDVAGPDSSVRFEVLSSDEKFLDFAQSLNDMSPLDACYNIVIYNLKRKCGELTEEELGKLSVQLLNCQSEVEDRPVYACTNSMSLADCTKSMDGTTWNSYQIVGNRARAMCYAAQQLQFRKLTEITVNRLATVAGEQVKSLNDLKAGQEQLHSLTAETVRKLYESQQDLLSTQLSLREAHEGIFNHIAINVKEIMQEKALIASGNQELAAMTDNIRKKLDVTAEKIEERELVEQTKHARILQDLKDIQDNTEMSVRKLDTSLQNLMKKFEEIDKHHSGMSSSLTKMNVTMKAVMMAVDSLGKNLSERINWISQLLDVTDDKLSAMSCCLLHIAYFFLVAVAATFLQVPIPMRLTMLVIIVGNVAAELNHNHSFDFAGLTVFIFAVYFGFKLIIILGDRLKFMPNVFPSNTSLIPNLNTSSSSSSSTQPLSPQEVGTLLHLLQRFSNSVSEHQTTTHTLVANGTVIRDTHFRAATPPSGLNRSNNGQVFLGHNGGNTLQNTVRAERTLIDSLRGRGSRSVSRSSTPQTNDSRSSTPISSRCQANTVTGIQCRLPVMPASEFCRVHTGR